MAEWGKGDPRWIVEQREDGCVACWELSERHPHGPDAQQEHQWLALVCRACGRASRGPRERAPELKKTLTLLAAGRRRTWARGCKRRCALWCVCSLVGVVCAFGSRCFRSRPKLPWRAATGPSRWRTSRTGRATSCGTTARCARRHNAQTAPNSWGRASCSRCTTCRLRCRSRAPPRACLSRAPSRCRTSSRCGPQSPRGWGSQPVCTGQGGQVAVSCVRDHGSRGCAVEGVGHPCHQGAVCTQAVPVR